MKKFFLSSIASACLVSYGFGQNSPPVKVRVLKDNTNLRAKPALNVEVVGQVSANQELAIKSMDAEWVEVITPTNIDFWVLGDYLKDGVVVCRQMVNVRAGPGINFSVVGQLTNSVQVEVRGSHADWVKIAPPVGCSLWVSRSLVELMPAAPVALPVKVQPPRPPAIDSASTGVESAAAVKPQSEAKKQESVAAAKPAPVTDVAVASGGESKPQEMDKTAEIKPPSDLDLIPDIGQGQWKQFAGVLKRRNFIVRSPSDFRLVADDQNGQTRTICFVKGNRAQLDALLYRELIISGRQYWVRRHSYPVVVPEKIILK